MGQRTWFSGMALALLLTGNAAAADFEIALVETPSAPVQYRNGGAGAQSVQASSAAAVMLLDPRYSSKERPVVLIGVENRGASAFNLTLAQVRVVDQLGRPIPLMSRAAAIASAEKSARSRETWTRVLSGLAAAGAGQGSSTSTTTGSVYGTGGSAQFGATTMTSTYDPQAQARAAAQAREDIERVQAQNARRIADAQRDGFAAQTIEPGQQHMTELGLSKLAKDVTALTVTIGVAGDVHSFPLTITRVK